MADFEVEIKFALLFGLLLGKATVSVSIMSWLFSSNFKISF